MKAVTLALATTLSVMLSISAEPPVQGRSQAPQSRAQTGSSSQCLCYVSRGMTGDPSNPYGAIHTIPLGSGNTCKDKCLSATAALNLQNEANILCHPSINVPNGTGVTTIYKEGSSNFQLAGFVGNLTNTPFIPSSQWKCPPTWYSNTSNQLGDITADQRCKKLAGTLTVAPFPANGTQIGSWGFTFFHEVWVYGTSANAGAAFHPSTPAQCHF